MTQPVIRTYAEFWPYYLREHKKLGTKALHIIGTAVALVLLALAALSGSWEIFLAAIVAGYFFAWVGHFFIERNRPATFSYPFWSLISDFRLFFTFVAGRLSAEYRRYGIST